MIERECEAPLEAIGASPRDRLGDAHRQRRVDFEIAGAELGTEGDRALAPGKRRLEVQVDLRHLGDIPVGAGKLVARPQWFEDGHGLVSRLPRRRDPRVEVGELRGPDEHVAFLEPVASSAIELEGLGLRRQSVLELLRQIALLGARREQPGNHVGAQPVGEAECPRVLFRGFTVRAETRGPLGSRRREAEQGLGVISSFGMVRKPGDIAAFTERCERPGMEIRALDRVDRLLDCPARKLVAEGHTAAVAPQHPGGEAFVEPLRLHAVELLEQPEVRADDGSDVEHTPGLAAQAGHSSKHGVADARRHPFTVAGESLGDEERVPAGETMELDRIDVEARGQRANALDRQRLQRDAPRGRYLSQDNAQWVVAADLIVAVGGNEKRVRPRQAAAQVDEQVEGRLVGPVDVLEDDKRGLTRQRLES